MNTTGNNRGASKGNRNAIRSGVYSFLATGRYPRGAAYVGRLVGQLRQSLESTVMQRESEVTVYNAAVIQSVCRHEGRAQLLQRWLRELEKGDNGASIHDRVSILKEIGSATDARDKCLRALGLHLKQEDDDTWPTVAATCVSAIPEASGSESDSGGSINSRAGAISKGNGH